MLDSVHSQTMPEDVVLVISELLTIQGGAILSKLIEQAGRVEAVQGELH